MATPGYYKNPSHRSCFEACRACFRCVNRFNQPGAPCNGCSGRHDPFGVTDPHPDDFCTCTQGVLRFVTRDSKLHVVPYKTNPFKGKVTVENKTEDEKEWDAYMNFMKEKLDDPNYDPISFVDVAPGKPGVEFKYLGDKPPS